MNTTTYLPQDRRRPKANGAYPIILRLVHQRKPVPLPTGYAALAEHWDSVRTCLKKGCPNIDNLTRANNILDKMLTKAIDVNNRLHDEGKPSS